MFRRNATRRSLVLILGDRLCHRLCDYLFDNNAGKAGLSPQFARLDEIVLASSKLATDNQIITLAEWGGVLSPLNRLLSSQGGHHGGLS